MSLMTEIEDTIQKEYCSYMNGEYQCSCYAYTLFTLYYINKTKYVNIAKSSIKRYSFEQLGYYEKIFLPIMIFFILYPYFDVPLIIDILVEISKKYFSHSTARFLHGVLSSVLVNKVVVGIVILK